MICSAVAFHTNGFGSVFQCSAHSVIAAGEVGDTGEHATAEPFVVQFLEPALDQVEP
jgi:hypothetical protein